MKFTAFNHYRRANTPKGLNTWKLKFGSRILNPKPWISNSGSLFVDSRWYQKVSAASNNGATHQKCAASDPLFIQKQRARPSSTTDPRDASRWSHRIAARIQSWPDPKEKPRRFANPVTPSSTTSRVRCKNQLASCCVQPEHILRTVPKLSSNILFDFFTGVIAAKNGLVVAC
jgi:hypothetical protein